MLLHQGALPKLSFSKFNGEHPKIFIIKCGDYFHIFNVPGCMWIMAASLHMEENTTKWLQVYKMKHGLGIGQRLWRQSRTNLVPMTTTQ
jgi:hypothetical protein